MQEYPFIFLGGYYLFLVWEFEYLNLFLQCEQTVVPRMLSVFSGRRRQWAVPAVSAYLLGSQQQQRSSGRWHRLLLVAGPWEVVMSLRQIYGVPRTFGSGSGRVCEFPGE